MHTSILRSAIVTMLNFRTSSPKVKRGGRGVLGAGLRGIGFSTDDVCEMEWRSNFHGIHDKMEEHGRLKYLVE